MEYKGQALQCSTLGNNITELIFDLQDGSVNKFDRNSLHELNEVVKQLEKDQSVKGLLISSVPSLHPLDRCTPVEAKDIGHTCLM